MTGERRSWTAALCCCMGWALTAAPAVAAPASLTLDVPDLGEPVGIAADLSEGRYWVTDGTTSGRTTVVSVGDDGTGTVEKAQCNVKATGHVGRILRDWDI